MAAWWRHHAATQARQLVRSDPVAGAETDAFDLSLPAVPYDGNAHLANRTKPPTSHRRVSQVTPNRSREPQHRSDGLLRTTASTQGST
jgi:hypothetical protein